MTISTTTRTKQYNGNNSTTVFAYDFNIQADSELQIYLGTPVGAPTTWTLKTLTTHYLVSSAGTPGGGNVTFGSAPPTGVGNVFIRRVTAKTQSSNYVENDPFSADTIEGNLDKLTQIQQDMQEEIDRCFKLGSVVPDAGNTDASSVVADRKNKLFAFDNSGDFSVTSEIGTVKGNWAASTAYVLRDIVKDTNNNNIYICITAHTSTGAVPISSNTDAAKWFLLVDAASATTSASAAAASATTATTQAGIATAKAVLTAADEVLTSADVVLTNADVVLAEAANVSAVATTGASAFKFVFDNSTTMADPGTGEVRFNHGTVGSVSAIAFDATSSDASNPDVSDFIANWSSGTNSAHEGYITIRKSGTPATFAVFSLTGAVVDNTGWLQCPVTFVDSNGTWSNADVMYISFAKSGNLGATGSTGSTGPQGATGTGSSGMYYEFETATADSDQGTGKVWLNHATVSSASILYIDDNDKSGTDISAFIATWDDSSATSDKGFIKIQSRGTPTDYAVFKISSSGSDNTAYWEFPVTHLVSAGTFSDTEVIDIFFTRSGDSGGVANRTVDTMTGDASDTTLSLSQAPGSENNVSITFDGVMQHHDTYSLSGSTITFGVAPPSGVKVEAVSGGNESIGTPSDGTVTLAKMAVNSIDSNQYVDGSIDTIHVGDNQITLEKMAGGTDGNIISYDASGNPVAIATGSDGQVLTSAGAGAPPAFEALPGGGKMLQCLSTAITATVSATTTSYATIAGMTVAITPSATSSKVLVSSNFMVGNTVGTNNPAYRIIRDSTVVFVGDAASSRTPSACQTNAHNINLAQNGHIQFLDSPSSTSAITYALQWIGVNSGAMYLNRGATNSDTTDYQRGASSITVMEIGA